jgi:hypothetical protein
VWFGKCGLTGVVSQVWFGECGLAGLASVGCLAWQV